MFRVTNITPRPKRPKRPRDSQRSRVYAWESNLPLGQLPGYRPEHLALMDPSVSLARQDAAPATLPLEECHRIASAAAARYGVSLRSCDVRKPLRDGKARRASGGAECITLPEWARSLPTIILHETAHLIMARLRRDVRHGPLFVGVYADLMGWYYAPTLAQAPQYRRAIQRTALARTGRDHVRVDNRGAAAMVVHPEVLSPRRAIRALYPALQAQVVQAVAERAQAAAKRMARPRRTRRSPLQMLLLEARAAHVTVVEHGDAIYLDAPEGWHWRDHGCHSYSFIFDNVRGEWARAVREARAALADDAIELCDCEDCSALTTRRAAREEI